MDRRNFLSNLALGAGGIAVLGLASKASAATPTRCRCGLGYDTDGDGDCPACARASADKKRHRQEAKGANFRKEPTPIGWQSKVTPGAWDGTAMVYDVTKGKKTKRWVAKVYCTSDIVPGPAPAKARGYIASIVEPVTPVPLPTDREPSVKEAMLAQGMALVTLHCTEPVRALRYPKVFDTLEEAQQAAEARFYQVYPHLAP